MSTTEEIPGSTTSTVAGLTPPLPGWGSRSIKRILLGAAATYAATVSLSAVLSALLIFAAASAIATAIGGTSVASGQVPAQIDTSDLGALVRVLLTFTSYSFLASHFTPLELSGLGGATYSVIGVGSLSIALVALLIPFMFTRRLERLIPMPSMNSAVGRGVLVAVPYWVGTFALYLPSFVSVGPSQLGITLHPSSLGLVVPALLVGIGGGLGAASARSVQHMVGASLLRGVARGLVGLVVGLIITGLIAGVWLTLEIVQQGSGAPSTSPGSISPAAQDLGWSLIALVPFYIGNVVAIVWSAALSGFLFSASPWHPLIFAGPVLGAVIGSLQLRRDPDRIEQVSFAGTFAIATGVLAFATTPAIINGPSLVSDGWIRVAVALAIGAGTAFLAPYLLGWSFISSISSAPPLTWLVKPVLATFPRETREPAAFFPDSLGVSVPSFHLGRVHAAIGACLIALVAAGIAGNAQLSSRFSPDATAVDYLVAQSHRDTKLMWSMVTFEGSSATSTPLLTQEALQNMLSYGSNANLHNITVRDSARVDDSNYLVTLHFTKNSQEQTTRLHIRRDASRSNLIIYPAWRVVVAPSAIRITAFLHAGTITVDGIDAGVSDGSGSVEVIPGEHDVALLATSIFDGDHQSVDAANDTAVTFTATLTPAATTAVNKVVGDLFAHCAAIDQVRQSGCPNSTYAFGDHQSHVHWSLIGDPTAAMKLSIADQVDTIEARGDWKMHVSYDSWYDFDPQYVRHWDEDVSGYFDDTLHWNGSGFDIVSQSGF